MNVKDFTNEELLAIMGWYNWALDYSPTLDESDRAAVLKIRVALDQPKEEQS